MNLSEDQIASLLQPYLPLDQAVPATLYRDLALYLDLLLRWNARTNLTAIRDSEEIVRRHFGESLFAGATLVATSAAPQTLLDFGSGAGFPGLPIQLLLPELSVTLAESQGKKAAFLREAVRTLGLKTTVWSERVEAMPPASRFNTVTLRAVDRMEVALAAAFPRVAPGGTLLAMGGRNLLPASPSLTMIPIPVSAETYLYRLIL